MFKLLQLALESFIVTVLWNDLIVYMYPPFPNITFIVCFSISVIALVVSISVTELINVVKLACCKF